MVMLLSSSSLFPQDTQNALARRTRVKSRHCTLFFIFVNFLPWVKQWNYPCNNHKECWSPQCIQRTDKPTETSPISAENCLISEFVGDNFPNIYSTTKMYWCQDWIRAYFGLKPPEIDGFVNMPNLRRKVYATITNTCAKVIQTATCFCAQQKMTVL